MSSSDPVFHPDSKNSILKESRHPSSCRSIYLPLICLLITDLVARAKATGLDIEPVEFEAHLVPIINLCNLRKEIQEARIYLFLSGEERATQAGEPK